MRSKTCWYAGCHRNTAAVCSVHTCRFKCFLKQFFFFLFGNCMVSSFPRLHVRTMWKPQKKKKKKFTLSQCYLWESRRSCDVDEVGTDISSYHLLLFRTKSESLFKSNSDSTTSLNMDKSETVSRTCLQCCFRNKFFTTANVDEAVKVNTFYREDHSYSNIYCFLQENIIILSILTEEALNNCRQCLWWMQIKFNHSVFCHSPVDTVEF